MTPTAFDILWYLPLFPTFPQKLGADFDLETKPGVTLAELTSTLLAVCVTKKKKK